jgi:hypothetical protein
MNVTIFFYYTLYKTDPVYHLEHDILRDDIKQIYFMKLLNDMDSIIAYSSVNKHNY